MPRSIEDLPVPGRDAPAREHFTRASELLCGMTLFEYALNRRGVRSQDLEMSVVIEERAGDTHDIDEKLAECDPEEIIEWLARDDGEEVGR